MLKLLEMEIKLPFSVSPMSVAFEALVKTYGFDTPFALFWVQLLEGRITAAVSKVDSHVTVAAGEGFDPQEMREFLKVIGFSSLLGEKRVLEDLGFKIYEKGIIMKYNPAGISGEEGNFESCNFELCQEPPYREIYDLLRSPEAFGESIPPYEHWLCDISARVRKNCARVLFSEMDGKCVSCGMLTFESDDGAIIGAVATEESFRKKGYGSGIVKGLCRRAERDRKTAVLMCREDKVSFYEKLGFKITGEFSLVSGVKDE